MPLERGTRAKRNQRHAMLGRDPNDARGLLHAARPHDHVGPRAWMKRLVVAVLSEDIGARAHAVGTEQVSQRAQHRVNARRRGARHTWQHHGHRAEIDRSPRRVVLPDQCPSHVRTRSDLATSLGRVGSWLREGPGRDRSIVASGPSRTAGATWGAAARFGAGKRDARRCRRASCNDRPPEAGYRCATRGHAAPASR